MKLIKYLRSRLKENRVRFGYTLWIGLPFTSILFGILGYGYNLALIIPLHLLGLFIVVKYDWFKEEVPLREVKRT